MYICVCVRHLHELYLYAFIDLGDGKTHYILNLMQRNPAHKNVIISIDESFTVRHAINKLRDLDYAAESVIFFNFTLLPPNVRIYTYVMWHF